MQITQNEYARAAGCCVETAGRRLKAVPWRGKRHNERLYHIALALPTIKRREVARGAVANMLELATAPADSLYIGDEDAMNMAARLLEWLPADMRARGEKAQNSFVVGVAHSNVCAPAVVENLRALQVLFVLQPDVLRHILTGAPADVEHIAPAFALVNNGAFHNIDIQEAA